MSKFMVKEGIIGYWHYHIAERQKYVSLCGKKVMDTAIPLRAWGASAEHLPLREKWCEECMAIYARPGETMERQ